VLELGCGTGRTLLPIARDGINCVGVDASPARTALAEEPEHLGATFHDGRQEIRRWDTVTRDLSRQVMTVRFRFEATAHAPA
jgi:cyclopropane fatty-acyl-phospholipid synthase-like methyltransferase